MTPNGEPVEMSSEMDPVEKQAADDDSDVIVIKKSWLITAAVAVAAFAIGGAAGYFLATAAFERGAASAALLQAAQEGAQAPQPTQPPPRIEGVSADDDPFLGPEDAPITIVEFSDFQCPYCARFRQQTFDALFEQYGDQIRLVYRDFPLNSIHPEAQKAAEASQCAHEQGKYWEMHDAMFANQAITGLSIDALSSMAEQIGLDVDTFTACVDSGKYADEVANDLRDGSSYGVTGTPTFFINGVRLVGAQPLVAFTTIIDQELQ